MKMDIGEEAEAFVEKVVVPIRRTRAPDPEAAQARAKLLKEQLELARRELVATGVDPDRLDQLAAEHAKSGRKLADQARQRAVAMSEAAARRLADLAPVVLPADPIQSVIDQVTFIRSFADQGVVLESNIAPFDNWARYRLESGNPRDGVGRLSFFALWQNQQNTPTVMMARPNLVVNAHLSCDAEGFGTSSWFGAKSEARATVRARTTVWSMDSSVSSIVHDRQLASVGASGGFFGDDDSSSVELSEVLPASGVAVPPQAYTLIEVELLTEWTAFFGSVVFDAEDGAFRVSVPNLIITELRT